MDPVTLVVGGVVLFVIWKASKKKSSSDGFVDDTPQPLPQEFSDVMEHTEIAYGVYTSMMKEID